VISVNRRFFHPGKISRSKIAFRIDRGADGSGLHPDELAVRPAESGLAINVALRLGLVWTALLRFERERKSRLSLW
jgi:hypothetical protein